VPLIAGEITRLLIDLNRSAERRGLFSEFSRHLPPDLKARLRRVHEEHWRRVSGALESCLSRRARVVHVGVHTFTPVLGEEPRDFDVGVLYDPKRAREKELSLAIGDVLGELGLRVRRNAPYRGVADGMTTAFRRRLPQERYLGLELEFNQERFAKLRGGEAAIVHGLAARLLSPEIST
jgi:predicted N-formylglutamate amidohydrolase